VHKYKIVFAPLAEKQLLKLDRFLQVRILNAIHKLSEKPNLGKILKGELREYRSYRIGDYRVIYFIQSHLIQIDVIRVAHRREVYSSRSFS